MPSLPRLSSDRGSGRGARSPRRSGVCAPRGSRRLTSSPASPRPHARRGRAPRSVAWQGRRRVIGPCSPARALLGTALGTVGTAGSPGLTVSPPSLQPPTSPPRRRTSATSEAQQASCPAEVAGREGVPLPARHPAGHADLARYYGTEVVPERRDEAKVEVAVQVAHRWVLARQPAWHVARSGDHRGRRVYCSAHAGRSRRRLRHAVRCAYGATLIPRGSQPSRPQPTAMSAIE